MKERKKGAIVFLFSIMALGAAKNWVSYNASKSHNLLFAEGLGEELKARRVARCGLWMLGCGRRTHTAGILNKIIALATRITPRFLNTKIFSLVVRSLQN